MATTPTWNKQIATALASEENIMLTEKHWQVIYFLRDFYEKYQISPNMRAIVKALNLSSIDIHLLFPNGAALQANKIAGLPKPINCI